ncbi:hypothetical protein SAMN05216411_102197 [Nitrosospira multiformis]|nr:hypothetical protein SAMN05216411_102197 [Nitrosospira multiformis]
MRWNREGSIENVNSMKTVVGDEEIREFKFKPNEEQEFKEILSPVFKFNTYSRREK